MISPNMAKLAETPPVVGSVMLRKFLKDESGATAIEYGLIAALVAVACIVALTSVGGSLKGLFETVDSKLKTANP
jgi:pilus assembly protein Flp/PilA